ncbi:MAG: MarC family protein [Flavobacteriaceae bacterium]
MDLKEILTASMVFFAVIDIIGSIPIIIALREKAGHIQSEKAALVVALIMVAFLFLGEQILHLIGIDVNSIAVAGSFVIFFLALEMILGITLFKVDAPEVASIVSLPFPIIAGVGTMTSLLSLHAEYDLINIIVAILLNVIIVYAILKFSFRLEKLLGKQGIDIIRKVFGIVLLSIAVKLFASNVGKIVG